MAILNIRIIGDPVLRTVADPVTEFGPELEKLVADMTETMEDVEGAGLAVPVRRHRTTRVTGVDLHGNEVFLEGEGMLARVFQHETDHLDGILFTDRLEGEDRKAALRAIRNANYDAITEQTTSKRAKTVGSSFGGGSFGQGSSFGIGQ